MKNTFFLALTGLLSLSCSRVDLSSQLSSGNDPFGNLAGSANQKTTNENIPTSSSSSNRNDTLPVGTWVETAFPDATFFKSYPIFGKKPTQTLPVASAAKIISHRGAYSKVELNTGAVGYIPSSMLIEQAQQQQETYSAPEPRELTSEPAPPTENEILQKIRERQQQAEAAASSTTAAPSVPSVPSGGGFVAPEPEVQGIAIPASTNLPSAPISIDRPTQASDPSGGSINQDASLELRLTEEFAR